MVVIPAIDVKDGRCVRLRQGDMAAETVYSADVPLMARRWEEAGAGIIHLVDLNGAVEGEPKNFPQIEAVRQAVRIEIQVGGGIRNLSTVRRYLEAGDLEVEVLSRGIAWLDTGTCAALHQASNFIEAIQERQGLKVACLEEVAWRKRFITTEQLVALGERMGGDYGAYLKEVAADESPFSA